MNKRATRTPQTLLGLVVLVILVVIVVWLQVQRAGPPGRSETTQTVDQAEAAVQDSQQLLEGQCSGVSDGDTLTILVDEAQYEIRVASIDCPEQEQPFSTDAEQFTSEFCLGKPLAVRVIDVDREGRQVGFVTVEGQDLSRELLRAGLAWHYKHYDRNPELASLEDEARAAKQGLWGDPAPIAPWDWRRGARPDATTESVPQ